MKSAILHIGYPKTATKWFQNEFYPKVPNIYPVKREDLFNRFVFNDIFSFSPVEFQSWLTQEAATNRVVVCDEILVGGLDIGFGSGEFVELMSHRLNDVFPDAQVVIFIRNQHQALASTYSHYVMSGGTYSPSRFLGIKPMFRKPFMGYHCFNPKLFDYDKLINHYITLYGTLNVHIFLYEDFAENPVQFIEQFCKTLQIDIPENLSLKRVNVRLSYIALQMQRFLNRFTLGNTPFKQYFVNIPSLYPIARDFPFAIDKYFRLPSFTFSGKIQSWIELRYGESNKNLARWIDRDRLKRWGYPL